MTKSGPMFMNAVNTKSYKTKQVLYCKQDHSLDQGGWAWKCGVNYYC